MITTIAIMAATTELQRSIAAVFREIPRFSSVAWSDCSTETRTPARPDAVIIAGPSFAQKFSLLCDSVRRVRQLCRRTKIIIVSEPLIVQQAAHLCESGV